MLKTLVHVLLIIAIITFKLAINALNITYPMLKNHSFVYYYYYYFEFLFLFSIIKEEPCSSMARTTPPLSHCPGMNAEPSSFTTLKNFHTFKREPSESSVSSGETSPKK